MAMSSASGREDSEQLNAALEYARAGYYSVAIHGITTDGLCTCGRNPCPDKPGKHPCTPHGEKDASIETRVLCDMFNQRSHANIAIVLEPSSLVDIAPDSPEWLQRFQQRGLPRTATFRSGGGEGHRHYLYRRPENCHAYRICRTGEYDIMAKGYCVAPPSWNVTGRQYEWIIPPSEFPQGLPDAPDWAVAMLWQAAEKTPKEKRGDIGDAPPVQLPKTGLAYWLGERVKEKPEGVRTGVPPCVVSDFIWQRREHPRRQL